MFINSDFSDLLRIFNENGVKYLVIGGMPLFTMPNHASRKT